MYTKSLFSKKENPKYKQREENGFGEEHYFEGDIEPEWGKTRWFT